MDLKVISWNCRGLSNSGTTARIHDFIKNSHPDFLCLVETKTNASRIYRFCAKLDRRWDWAAIPSVGFSGGIIVLWSRSIGLVTPIAVNRHALHLVISTCDHSWILTTVYNSQFLSEHKSLWNSLEKINALDSPWLITGDFNAVTGPEEI